MSFPTADQIATAIVLAARFHGEDPQAVARGELFQRSRHVAWQALAEAFPDASRDGLARCLAYGSDRPGNRAATGVIQSRKRIWWIEDHIDEIVGALLSEPEEEQGSQAKASEDNGATEPQDEQSEAVDSVAGDASRPASGRSDAATSERTDVTAGETAPFPTRFDPDERRAIASMWRRGASAVTIGAAIGSDADTIRAFAKANPQLCPPPATRKDF